MGTEAPDGSIVISPKEFYDGVRQDISDIKTAVAPLSPMVEDVNELKARVTALEARVWRASGFAAAVGLAGGYIIPQLVS
jgi:hypothetical protein